MKAEGVSVHYSHHAALMDVNLSIAEGEITALVGPSGCGKSTFLQTLNRLTDLIPGCRVQGSVTLDDRTSHATTLPRSGVQELAIFTCDQGFAAKQM